jgi:hypothetical protein
VKRITWYYSLLKASHHFAGTKPASFNYKIKNGPMKASEEVEGIEHSHTHAHQVGNKGHHSTRVVLVDKPMQITQGVCSKLSEKGLWY